MPAPSSSSSLGEWLRWLESLSPNDIDLGLERVRAVLARLSLPRPARRLTVGGTNGKGSTVAMLVAMLRHDGRSVGSYTSPHVLHYCERVCVDGRPVADSEMIAAFAAVEAARADVPLTYFEFGTLAALCAFAARDVHTQVLEVGLGGRLDAVNAVDPDAVLITNVSLDHCDWLGDDVESIAAEKAGIFRAGTPAVFGAARPPRAVLDAAALLGVDLIVAGRDFTVADGRGDSWSWRGRGHALSELPRPSMAGDHQIDNAAAAFALLEAAGEGGLLRKPAASSALLSAELPGRQQTVGVDSREWLLDGAHNAAGARALAETLRKRAAGRACVLVLGVLADKDVDAIIEALMPRVDHWIACAPDSPRALDADRLALRVATSTGQPCRIAPSVGEAIAAASALGADADLRVIAGSFYLVAPALQALRPD